MLGGGFVKAMKDAVDYNRSLLGHDPDRRYLRRRKNAGGQKLEGGPVEMRHVEGILMARRKYRERNATLNVVFVWVVMAMIVGVTAWILVDYLHSQEKDQGSAKPAHLEPAYFSKHYRETPDGFVTVSEYYFQGPKAAETTLKDGKKHMLSEAYYPTGEQFRQALYYHDTLMRQVYRYRDGGVIKRFPRVTMDRVYHVTIPAEGIHPRLSFDFFDGKIVEGTYREFR